MARGEGDVGANAPGFTGWGQPKPPAKTTPPPPAPDPFAFHFPKFHAPDYEAIYAQQAAAAAEAQRAAERAAGIQERDSLYSQYLNAAGEATDFINNEINREMSNARLLGIDYQINDEMKSQRISNYFASVWGEGDQSQLENLFSQWGKPKGFKGFTLERGNASAYTGGQETPEQSVSATGTKKPKTLASSPEEETLSKASLLGA